MTTAQKIRIREQLLQDATAAPLDPFFEWATPEQWEALREFAQEIEAELVVLHNMNNRRN